jgi:hypothetical protein
MEGGSCSRVVDLTLSMTGKDTLTMYPSHFVITHNTGICNIALTSAQTYTGTLYKHVKWARFATNRRDPAELGYQVRTVDGGCL